MARPLPTNALQRALAFMPRAPHSRVHLVTGNRKAPQSAMAGQRSGKVRVWDQTTQIQTHLVGKLGFLSGPHFLRSERGLLSVLLAS